MSTCGICMILHQLCRKGSENVCLQNFLLIYWTEEQYRLRYVKKNKYTAKKLKKNKTYYVRVRAYRVQAGNKVYGKWSKAGFG